jgi:hypothetical protein
MTGIGGDQDNYRKDSIEYGVVSGSMAYDIAALQYLYGANMSHNSGDNTYLYKLAYNPDKTWQKVLADFSEGTENQTNVLDIIGGGVQYDLWVA